MRTAILIFALATLTPWARAGPIAPPVGPVAPTHKTLTEIEPRQILNDVPGDAGTTHLITQSGSYYLVADVLGEPGKEGIIITASGVTIDLNGFTVDGLGVGNDGIATSGSNRLGRITNGHVNNWTGYGISALGGSISHITASNNGNFGIELGYGSIEHCSANSNGGIGGFGLSYSTATHCVATDSIQNGFFCENSVLIGCQSEGSGANGFLLYGTSATDCTAHANTEHGFSLDNRCVLDNCRSQYNTLDGFNTLSHAVFTACVANFNTGHGFRLDGLSTADNCMSHNNGGDGFDAGGDGAVLRGCVATENAVNGITNSSGQTIDCQSNDNSVGFRVGRGFVRGCLAMRNTSHGFDISSETRVESNVAQYNTGNGFDLRANGQILFIKNSANGNGTDFLITAGNLVAPVVDMTAGGGVITELHSMSNFRH